MACAANGRWLPAATPSRVLMFFHGGGYCSGSIVSHRRMVTEAGRAARMRTLAIGYRLAPEHPYPAAHQDALTAWRFLRRQGVPANRIVVGGDSAGGNLTVTLINGLRAAGEDLPACAWLVSPWTDLTMSGATLATKDAVDPLIHKGYLEELAEAYVPGTVDRKDPLISPLFADLHGFPPILIQVGSAETLLADASRFAAAAGAADVDVTLQIWPHMIHAWPLWNAALEDGRRALAQRRRFHPRPTNPVARMERSEIRESRRGGDGPGFRFRSIRATIAVIASDATKQSSPLARCAKRQVVLKRSTPSASSAFRRPSTSM